MNFTRMPRILVVVALLSTLQAHAADIHDAASSGDLTALRTILAAGQERVAEPDDGGYTPLHKAAYAGQVEAAAFLIAQGADVDALSTSGSASSFMLAIASRPSCEKRNQSNPA